jgi:hypothetical protein
MYQETERDGTTTRVRRTLEELADVKEKICCVCKTEKPVRLFNRNRSNADGYQYDCGMCQSHTVKMSRQKKRMSENEQ